MSEPNSRPFTLSLSEFPEGGFRARHRNWLEAIPLYPMAAFSGVLVWGLRKSLLSNDRNGVLFCAAGLVPCLLLDYLLLSAEKSLAVRGTQLVATYVFLPWRPIRTVLELDDIQSLQVFSEVRGENASTTHWELHATLSNSGGRREVWTLGSHDEAHWLKWKVDQALRTARAAAAAA